MNLALLGVALLFPADVPADKVEVPADRVELLWSGGAPGAVGDEEADKPSLTVFLPPADKAVGTAVIVCPGGGYQHLAATYEGKEPAQWLNQRGIAAFVLRYRLAPRYRHPAPMHDIQRAIRTVRARAKEWGVDPHKIGVWGFSAGGHLAATAATHFDDGAPAAADKIDRVSCRPDFAILSYPVITFLPPFGHRGSRDNLLGKDADEKLIDSLCNEKQVTADTPPTFLFHTNSDAGVTAENSVLFYLALRKAKVPAELHIYEKGKHGVGLAPKDAILATWTARLDDWFKVRGLVP
jgi:acetyl esterase/lipase